MFLSKIKKTRKNKIKNIISVDYWQYFCNIVPLLLLILLSCNEVLTTRYCLCAETEKTAQKPLKCKRLHENSSMDEGNNAILKIKNHALMQNF